ncbi:hypothetical protein [Actinomadura sp. DC4]|uniref:hypothetical protein n=1 Tax=Actinomadura sp. DC4 TaxID=3055069 RepID=UPI0025B22F00|nr:hypothetical protein [Actinomadura sp. DC4]MDN3354234.1 hypothetical protein [Actinomadura sp. DC4]
MDVSQTTETDVRPEAALLGIYLNDHLTGATFGTELASRIARTYRGSKDAQALADFAAEVAGDRAALIEMMAALGVPVRQYKALLGWVAEKAGRLKPNGRLLDRSPLSGLVEFEAMRLGVEGKGACWRTLQTLADRDDRLDRGRLEDLLARADRQADLLEGFRVRVAAELVGVD